MNTISTNTIDSTRNYGLDILRATAIVFVLIEHGNDFLFAAIHLKAPHLDGVKLFFVLSGYLIGGILIKTLQRDYSIKELYKFWIRRWFRTLPNYYLILIILIGFNLFSHKFKGTYTSFFFFSQNLFFRQERFFLESWSLAVEEWFYLLFPIVLYLFNKAFPQRPKKTLLISISFFLLGSTLIRLYKDSYLDITIFKDWDMEFRKQVLTRLDSIVFGVLGAYLSIYYHSAWVKYKKLLLILGLILLLADRAYFLLLTHNRIEYGWYSNIASFTISSIACLALLPFLSEMKSGTGKLYQMITFISIISYSLYMVNLSIVRLELIPYTNSLLKGSGIDIYLNYSDLILYWLFTILLAISLYRFFEKPITDIRERFVINSKTLTKKL